MRARSIVPLLTVGGVVCALLAALVVVKVSGVEVERQWWFGMRFGVLAVVGVAIAAVAGLRVGQRQEHLQAQLEAAGAELAAERSRTARLREQVEGERRLRLEAEKAAAEAANYGALGEDFDTMIGREERELLVAQRALYATQKEMANALSLSEARLHRLLKKHGLLRHAELQDQPADTDAGHAPTGDSPHEG